MLKIRCVDSLVDSPQLNSQIESVRLVTIHYLLDTVSGGVLLTPLALERR
jgi:hypothetical protein